MSASKFTGERKFAECAHPNSSDSNLTHIYFKIGNQKSFVEHFRRLAVAPYATDDVVVTLTDPDGRKVMFG